MFPSFSYLFPTCNCCKLETSSILTSFLFFIIGPLMKPNFTGVETDGKLKWTAPPTLNGTVIDGYNVSVNGSHYAYTEDTEVSIHLNPENISSCPLPYRTEVEVSAFNGLNGDSAEKQLDPASSNYLDCYVSLMYMVVTLYIYCQIKM